MNPWEYRKRDGTLGLCAWCLGEHGQSRNAQDSHGVCPGHAQAMLASIGLRVARDAEGTGTICRTTTTDGTPRQAADLPALIGRQSAGAAPGERSAAPASFCRTSSALPGKSGYEPGPATLSLQGGAVAARVAHNHEVPGAIPGPATNSRVDGHHIEPSGMGGLPPAGRPECLPAYFASLSDDAQAVAGCSESVIAARGLARDGNKPLMGNRAPAEPGLPDRNTARDTFPEVHP